jgi:hypothetical protein
MTILAVHQGDALLRATFSPFGTPLEPEDHARFGSIALLKMALAHVSLALRALHGSRLIHNDVRWPNVVQSAGKYVLVDYDFMQCLGEDGLADGVRGLDPASHWVRRLEERHGVEIDVWGLLLLVRTGMVGGVALLRTAGDEVGRKLECGQLDSVSARKAVEEMIGL